MGVVIETFENAPGVELELRPLMHCRHRARETRHIHVEPCGRAPHGITAHGRAAKKGEGSSKAFLRGRTFSCNYAPPLRPRLVSPVGGPHSLRGVVGTAAMRNCRKTGVCNVQQ